VDPQAPRSGARSAAKPSEGRRARPPAPVHVGIVGSRGLARGDLAERRRLAALAADSGLDHLFVADHVSFHGGAGMDGLIQAAFLSALHPSLGLHVGVYLLALRHPVPVARQIATLAESAPGRLVFGVGVGGEDRHEVEVCGVDPRTRGRRTDESLGALRRLLSGEKVSHRGEFFAFDDALILPAPKPPIPLVVGGRSSAAIRRVGRLGDGWLGVWCSPRRFREVVDEVASLAAAAGRRDVAWRHGLQVWTGYGRSRPEARDGLAAAMESFYRIPFERFERYSPSGSPADVAEFLAPYVEAGCRSFNVDAIAASEEAGIEAVAEVKRLLVAATR
jgi:alkanesulfonate monooxygenase SsuD/methylene tetrahydromethanopterin reductase-like flavin-dependent oxidoreductase (luciferase family)